MTLTTICYGTDSTLSHVPQDVPGALRSPLNDEYVRSRVPHRPHHPPHLVQVTSITDSITLYIAPCTHMEFKLLIVVNSRM